MNELNDALATLVPPAVDHLGRRTAIARLDALGVFLHAQPDSGEVRDVLKKMDDTRTRLVAELEVPEISDAEAMKEQTEASKLAEKKSHK